MKSILMTMFKGTIKAIAVEIVNEAFDKLTNADTIATAKQKVLDLVEQKLG